MNLLEDVIAKVLYPNNAKPNALVYPGNFPTQDFQKIISQHYQIMEGPQQMIPNATMMPSQYPVAQNGYSIDLINPNNLGGPVRYFEAPRLKSVTVSPSSSTRPAAPSATCASPPALLAHLSRFAACLLHFFVTVLTVFQASKRVSCCYVLLINKYGAASTKPEFLFHQPVRRQSWHQLLCLRLFTVPDRHCPQSKNGLEA